MAQRIPDTLLEEFSRFVECRMGLSFPREKWGDLANGVRSMCREFGCDNEERFVRHIMSTSLSKRQIEMLAADLTVGETYFFREKNALDAFEHFVLSDVMKTRRSVGQPLRIWCAGCASGEEPYTIAMMLQMLLPDLKDWNICILATDINPHFLEKAMRGVYTSWSFRNVPERIIDRFFTKKGSRFEILPEIKAMVTFSYLNLVHDKYPALLSNTNGMDMIFCRNVLMYFAPETIKTVVHNFRNCLTDGGLLIVSQTELNDEYFPGFEKLSHAGAMLYRKPDPRAEKSSPPEIIPRTAPPLSTPIREKVTPFVLEKKIETPGKAAPKEDTPVGPVEDLYETAGKAFAQKEYARAEELLGLLIACNPGHAEALTMMARVCANQGRLDDALCHMDEAIKTDNMLAGRHYLHAAILKEQGLKQEAMAALKKAVYLEGDFVLAHYAMGSLALASGNRVEAERHFINALKLLRKHGDDDILPESQGMTVGRLIDLIESMKWRKKKRDER